MDKIEKEAFKDLLITLTTKILDSYNGALRANIGAILKVNRQAIISTLYRDLQYTMDCLKENMVGCGEIIMKDILDQLEEYTNEKE